MLNKIHFWNRKRAKFIIIILTVVLFISFFTYIFSKVYKSNEKDKNNNFSQKTQEGYNKLKLEFDSIFSNSLINENNKYDVKKVDKEKNLIYTKYENNTIEQNHYDLDINIPYININSEIINKYNDEIKVFQEKVESILKTKNQNTIFTVEYNAYIDDNILSLIIRSNLKERTNPQRVIIQTYNYDLQNNKEVTIQDVLKKKNLDKELVQDKINKEIEVEQKKAQDLKSLGYNIFVRDSKSSIYKIENLTEFYICNDVIYIIYAYGNEKLTSEMDMIIL